MFANGLAQPEKSGKKGHPAPDWLELMQKESAAAVKLLTLLIRQTNRMVGGHPVAHPLNETNYIRHYLMRWSHYF